MYVFTCCMPSLVYSCTCACVYRMMRVMWCVSPSLLPFPVHSLGNSTSTFLMKSRFSEMSQILHILHVHAERELRITTLYCSFQAPSFRPATRSQSGAKTLQSISVCGMYNAHVQLPHPHTCTCTCTCTICTQVYIYMCMYMYVMCTYNIHVH